MTPNTNYKNMRNNTIQNVSWEKFACIIGLIIIIVLAVRNYQLEATLEEQKTQLKESNEKLNTILKKINQENSDKPATETKVKNQPYSSPQTDKGDIPIIDEDEKYKIDLQLIPNLDYDKISSSIEHWGHYAVYREIINGVSSRTPRHNYHDYYWFHDNICETTDSWGKPIGDNYPDFTDIMDRDLITQKVIYNWILAGVNSQKELVYKYCRNNQPINNWYLIVKYRKYDEFVIYYGDKDEYYFYKQKADLPQKNIGAPAY